MKTKHTLLQAISSVSLKALKREKKNVKEPKNVFQLCIGSLGQAFLRTFQFQLVWDNPTMAALLVVNYLLTAYFLWEVCIGSESILFHASLLGILWATSYFGQVSETIAMGRGKAQADALKTLETTTKAKRLIDPSDVSKYQEIYSCDLQLGDYLYVMKGEIIPADGEIYTGAALIDESAVTGESAPVVRESGGDVSAVTGGTTVVSDGLVMVVTSKPGEGFLAKMISLVEGSSRRKTPNEEALSVLLTGTTLIFIIVVMVLKPVFDARVAQIASTTLFMDIDPFLMGIVFVCLITTTISALLPAIGIAGMDRLMKLNIIATSSRAIEAAGDADILMLDKTGTITLGNRQAAQFFPAPNIAIDELAYAAYMSSIADDTAEGKSIIRLVQEKFPEIKQRNEDSTYEYIPFSAKTRMSGIQTKDSHDRYLKGAIDAIEKVVQKESGNNTASLLPLEVRRQVEKISMEGGTPLVVVRNATVLGSIYLKDIVKKGLKERFSLLRLMGIQTVMITGDNPMTAAAISAEAGLDKFYGQVTPESKLDIIKKYQAAGHMVAMTGDGSNDAPALAQADVALAMNSGTQAAREAANLIDLDSNPTKLIEVVQVGKDLLITRGALTTFSLANDIAKYFVLLPALIAALSPQVATQISFIQFSSPKNACLAAGLFNAIIILILVPLALKGVRTKIQTGEKMFQRNLFLWGILGAVFPFIGIPLCDWIVTCIESI